jgi:hypothetical protein
LVALVLILLVTACGGGSSTRSEQSPEDLLTPLPQAPLIKRNAAYVAPRQCTISAKLVPSCGVLWGAAVNPEWDKGEDWDSAFSAFTTQTGRPLDVAHRFYAGDQLFPDAGELRRARHPGGAKVFFFNWKPAPELDFAAVAGGAVDDRIDREAAYLNQHVKSPFFLTINHEPENLIDETPGSGNSAADFRAMFRHVVERLRGQGVARMVSVVTYRGNPAYAARPWFEGLYPGDDVVDWIAFDPYVFPASGWDQPFPKALDRTSGGPRGWPGFYTWAVRTHPGKPIMLGEWGISQFFDDSRVVSHIDDVRRTLRTHSSLKALIYWDTLEVGTIGPTQMNNRIRRQAFAELASSTEVTGSPRDPQASSTPWQQAEAD